MEKTKCYQCGLVNWDGAVECRRCFSKLRSASKTVNLDRMPQEGVPQVKPVRFGVLAFLVLAGLIGFAAYKSLLPEERPSAASEAGRQLDEYGSTMTEPQKQAFKLKAASEAALKLEGEAAVKRIEAEKHPIPPPAMVDDKIPPPGTVYSVDKHGRVHQVR